MQIFKSKIFIVLSHDFIIGCFSFSWRLSAAVLEADSRLTNRCVSAEGRVEVTKQGRKRSNISGGKVFGELAVLQRCACTATVTGKVPPPPAPDITEGVSAFGHQRRRPCSHQQTRLDLHSPFILSERRVSKRKRTISPKLFGQMKRLEFNIWDFYCFGAKNMQSLCSVKPSNPCRCEDSFINCSSVRLLRWIWFSISRFSKNELALTWSFLLLSHFDLQQKATDPNMTQSLKKLLF